MSNILITDDEVVEALEGFQVSIAPVSDFVTIGENDVATVTVVDDDSKLK